MKKRDFLSICDLSSQEIWEVIFLAKKLKSELKNMGKNKPFLKGKQLVMLFEKPSLRTKVSFSIGINQLGGNATYFGPDEMGFGAREEIKDIGRVIARMGDFLAARVFEHAKLEELKKYSSIPVINALSDWEHPCQALADFFTIWEINGELKGKKIVYIGDANNNTAHSLCLGSALLGIDFAYAAPKEYWMD